VLLVYEIEKSILLLGNKLKEMWFDSVEELVISLIFMLIYMFIIYFFMQYINLVLFNFSILYDRIILFF